MCPTDSGGVFSLVAGYLATAATTILTSQHNPVLEDIAQGMTDRLMRNGSNAMTGALTLSADPVSALQAATKQYVDNLAAGLDVKASVLNATTANISLTGEQTIDGILTSTSRILVKNQTAPEQNGIYVTAAGAWSRALDMDNWLEVPGASVWVETGTVNGDTGWVATANAGGTIGVTALPWQQFGGAGAFQAASVLLSAIAALPIVSGDLTYGIGANAVARLPKATDTNVLTLAGGLPTWAAPSGGSGPPGGRLTLTTAVPVLTATVTSAGTVFYTPYISQVVPIYNGSSITGTDLGGELSNILANAATGNAGPAAVANNSNYDLFVWSNAGTPTLTRGPAWTSDTARGAGAGTTELVRVKGLMLNANAITNGPAAQRGTYVGTIRTNGTATCDYQFGALGASGTAGIVGVWNMYNRVNISMFVQDSTDSWTYTTATWRAANNSNTMRTSFICGLAEDSISASYIAIGQNSGALATDIIRSGIGYDSTSAISAGSTTGISTQQLGASPMSFMAGLTKPSDIGFHYVQALEYSVAVNTSTWYGDNGAPTLLQSGLTFSFRA